MSTAPNFKDRDTLAELSRQYMDKDVAKLCNSTTRTIAWWRAKYGIPAHQSSGRGWLRRRSALPIDEFFFSKIDTEEKAYFLGFLSADGYVSADGKRLSCSVSEVDLHIIEQFRSAIKSGHKVSTKISNGFSGSKPQKVINISCKQIVSDLAKYGVVPNKSHSLSYAQIDPVLERHYLRGLFDGDGSICERQIFMVGTRSLLNGMNNAFIRHGLPALHWTKREYPCTYGNRGHTDLLHWLYLDATVYLKRKRQKVIDHWQRRPGASGRLALLPRGIVVEPSPQ